MQRRMALVSATAALALSMALPAVADEGAGPGPEPHDAPDGLEHAYGALGANFNQDLGSINYAELELAEAEWVRGFYQMPQTDDGDVADHFAIEGILEAADRGYQTILTLSYPYIETSFPEPGSAEMDREFARLDQVLPVINDAVDIIVIGNEPFIQSLPDERDEQLNEFYEAVADHVIDFRASDCESGCDSLLYMGALNRLDLDDRHTPAAERWMDFVRETPEVEGVNIHPHMPEPEAVHDFLDYILPRMRDDQTFLVTEFSIVWYWKQHLEEPIDRDFALAYGFEPGTQVWEVVSDAIDNPVSETQWMDFLESSEWFMEQADFLSGQMEIFRGTGRLAVATYGFRQDDLMVEDFDPDKDPWLFNSVFAAYTVEPRQGMAAPGFWLDSFRDLQDHALDPACDTTITGPHRGPVQVHQGTTCITDAEVRGPITIGQSASVVLTGSTVTGPIHSSGAVDVQIHDNEIIGPVQVHTSSGEVSVQGNHITGPLACSGNDSVPTGGQNTVRGPVSGQCAHLAG